MQKPSKIKLLSDSLKNSIDCLQCAKKNARILELEAKLIKTQCQLDHARSISGIYKSRSI
jgi:hypothetical protein